jgi:anti-anti-sigma regulatory factor
MKPHLTSSAATAITNHSGNHNAAAEALAHAVSVDDRVGGAPAVYTRPRLELVSAPVWKHQLVLTGRLNHRTAVELEDEIECLCEEGVTILTLDLRQLEAIDSVGAITIARRGAACKTQGRDFAVIPGSPVVHHALVKAGAESLLAGDPGETGVVRLAAGTSHNSPRDTSTAIINDL